MTLLAKNNGGLETFLTIVYGMDTQSQMIYGKS